MNLTNVGMSFQWDDWVGSAGVFFCLAAYFLLQINKIKSTALSYSFMNALGSALILCSLFLKWNFSAFLMEFCWLLVSIYGLFAYGWRRRKNKHKS